MNLDNHLDQVNELFSEQISAVNFDFSDVEDNTLGSFNKGWIAGLHLLKTWAAIYQNSHKRYIWNWIESHVLLV